MSVENTVKYHKIILNIYLKQNILCQSGFRVRNFYMNFFILEMEPIGCPETSVTNYKWMLRNISEEWIYRLLSAFLHAGKRKMRH